MHVGREPCTVANVSDVVSRQVKQWQKKKKKRENRVLMKLAELLPSSRWLVQGCDTGPLTASSHTKFHVPVEFVFYQPSL